MTSRTCICTVVTRSHVPFARVLVDSIRAHHGEDDLDVLVCVIDGTIVDAPPGSTGIDATEVLRTSELRALPGRYSRQPLVVAAKAPLLAAALARGYQRAVFLDADMLALAPLDPVLEPAGGAIVLTPHVLAPLDPGAYLTGDSGREFERILLLSGVFNGGVVAVDSGANAAAFLSWWTDRLLTHCRHDVTNGLHYDQTWLDVVPGMFDGVELLRDASINVAYWNLPERPVTRTADGTWMASGEPMRLFHFSGFDPRDPHVPSRYRAAMTMSDMAGAAPLFADYAERLVAAGILETIELPAGAGV